MATVLPIPHPVISDRHNRFLNFQSTCVRTKLRLAISQMQKLGGEGIMRRIHRSAQEEEEEVIINFIVLCVCRYKVANAHNNNATERYNVLH